MSAPSRAKQAAALGERHDPEPAWQHYSHAQKTERCENANGFPVPTRFSCIAGRLEAQVSSLSGFIAQVERVADRLGGCVPEDPKKDREMPNAGCTAALLERENEVFDQLLLRFREVLERLETL